LSGIAVQHIDDGYKDVEILAVRLRTVCF